MSKLTDLTYILTDLMERDCQQALRLDQGLGVAFTPPNEHGRTRLTISRLAEVPTETEVKLVDSYLKRLLPAAAYKTLVTSPPVIIESQQGQHGTIGFTWYTCHQMALL